eukprot:TRINITY_DN506_c0_g1_i2.p1 TRINITY_DN506_c0_g1~~TRINITY_DN506_c0_g1_i2.p1  ORF type:complete len:167 (-),score=15.75 TRINITY_DN506_c0_g1_i2:624-1124(-)
MQTTLVSSAPPGTCSTTARARTRAAVISSAAFISMPTSPLSLSYGGGRRRNVCCHVALKPDSTTVSVDIEDSMESKIGSRVRVTAPLKVFHVPKMPELDLSGMEGVVKQYVGVWKGKRISANLPFKVEFFTQVPGRGLVKFFAHLKDDEFDFLTDIDNNNNTSSSS